MGHSSSSLNVIDRAILRISGRFGQNAREVERFIKFSIVGILGAVVDFTTLNILQLTILPPVKPYQNTKIAIATGVAFCAAVFSNFMWNRYWTYPDSRTRSFRRQLAIFYGINTAALFFRLLFVSVTFTFFGRLAEKLLVELSVVEPMTIESLNQLGTNISQAIAVAVAMFWNFGVNRMWTYNDVRRPGESDLKNQEDHEDGDDSVT